MKTSLEPRTRLSLSGAALDKFRDSGTLIVRPDRARPDWFDGRFLSASDLTREQAYFLQRQTGLGRTIGAGVARGLTVESLTAFEVRIEPGLGLTPTGELVVVPDRLTVNLADVAESERLDAAFGLSRRPRTPARGRSGLYVLALRAVEFTANPIASYPTTITGRRGVADGDVVEATAVTLVPYPDEGRDETAGDRRARIARDLFVDAASAGVPESALPLAMIELDRGVIQWLDMHLVRRGLSSVPADFLGLGAVPPGLVAAFMNQYDAHLDDVLAERRRARRGSRFAAVEHFRALPPAGRMPSAGIDPAGLTQIFFPADVDVELTVAPADEIPALVEESLSLPPIDLTLADEQLASTAVLVIIPIARSRLGAEVTKLESVVRAAQPAAPNLLARRRPIEMLRGLGGSSLITKAPVVDPRWRQLLADHPFLWFVRRRNLRRHDDVVGVTVHVAVDVVEIATRTRERMPEDLLGAYTRLEERASDAPAAVDMLMLLDTRALRESPELTEAALRELEARDSVDAASVREVTSRLTAPEVRDGLHRLDELEDNPLRSDSIRNHLSRAGVLPELAERIHKAPDDAAAEALVAEVREAARGPAAEARARLRDLLIPA